MLLKNTSPLIFTGKRKVELPKEFVLLDTSFHFQSLAVIAASESREMVSLNIEYEKLQQICGECHEKYKKKE
jgi:cytochrome c556